jgi:hypothetical protein
VVSKGVVPSVVVGKEQECSLGPTEHKGMHVREFGSVRNGYGFNLQPFAKGDGGIWT